MKARPSLVTPNETNDTVEAHDTWTAINSISMAGNDISDLAQVLLLLGENVDTSDLNHRPALTVHSRTIEDLAQKIDAETDILMDAYRAQMEAADEHTP